LKGDYSAAAGSDSEPEANRHQMTQ